MSAIVWDQVGERFYEAGISKGVFYDSDGKGVPWNGLISMEDASVGSVAEVHFDGIKFNDVVTMGDFKGILKAFTYPDEFAECQGALEDIPGFYVLNQPQSTFGLSYQTKVADDVHGIEDAYKLHLLYNLTALPAQKTFETLSLNTDPIEFEWTVTAIPEHLSNFHPTAHIVFDSRKIDPYLLKDIEDILYGTEEEDPKLPSLKGLSSFVRKWGRLVITDWGDGRWEAYSPLDDVITMLDETTFEITSDTAVYLDADTYEISSSEKNVEDV